MIETLAPGLLFVGGIALVLFIIILILTIFEINDRVRSILDDLRDIKYYKIEPMKRMLENLTGDKEPQND